jgi:hypothetical protein
MEWILIKIIAGPSLKIPNICSLYCKSSISFTTIQVATNSEPIVEDLMVFWALENQMMGAWFRKMTAPVCKWYVMRLPAWSVSMKQLICMALPSGTRIRR